VLTGQAPRKLRIVSNFLLANKLPIKYLYVLFKPEHPISPFSRQLEQYAMFYKIINQY